jgi:nitroimidazol reductase NimA-like FMN-containing flavoprotein (pyridoxamine 5'-phosphate oxidase superfamily)
LGEDGPARPTRRQEKEVTDRATLDEILHSAPVLALAFRADPAPYVVPVCFGLDGDTLYVHSALTGTKIKLLEADPIVGFCACSPVSITVHASACSSTASGRSVVGSGRARILHGEAERLRGLDAIMRHYRDARGGPPDRPQYRAESLFRTCVIAIHIDRLHGKSV